LKSTHIIFADVFEEKDLKNFSIKGTLKEFNEDLETNKHKELSEINNPVKITIDIIITTQELGSDKSESNH
jgi:hypothetical protein